MSKNWQMVSRDTLPLDFLFRAWSAGHGLTSILTFSSGKMAGLQSKEERTVALVYVQESKKTSLTLKI